ncbi:MAG: B-box zinc finger protein [Candidatus Nanohalobium sp.]
MKPCEYCGEKEAVSKCSVCGSMVCEECSLEYGCKACGGKQEFT